MQLSEEEFLSLLVETIESQYKGNKAAFGDAHGISRSYLNDVVNGHRKPGELIAKALGYTKTVVFVLEDGK